MQNIKKSCMLDKTMQAPETVGAFQKLPMVMPAMDILSSAKRKARNVTATKGITNIAKRVRNKGAKQLDALMKELAVPLRMYIERFPKKQSLHPYERSLVDLTFGEGIYEEVLKRVDDLRKQLLCVGKQHASLCAQRLEKDLLKGLHKRVQQFARDLSEERQLDSGMDSF
ncbi:hypothetical protein HPP92_027052 [Vanilla planifolia]|uniref:NOG1 N-terminal helical domain-containing protein n=1 Tax=Vanilla planifolia TaxID=51239 RepID=A0A835PGY2_VANPL|nr:hypothetical protein HPP92_027052 [Vanilla planifolia]